MEAAVDSRGAKEEEVYMMSYDILTEYNGRLVQMTRSDNGRVWMTMLVAEFCI